MEVHYYSVLGRAELAIYEDKRSWYSFDTPQSQRLVLPCFSSHEPSSHRSKRTSDPDGCIVDICAGHCIAPSVFCKHRTLARHVAASPPLQRPSSLPEQKSVERFRKKWARVKKMVIRSYFGVEFAISFFAKWVSQPNLTGQSKGGCLIRKISDCWERLSLHPGLRDPVRLN